MEHYRKIKIWKSTSSDTWTDWKWQIQNVITDVDTLEKVIPLSKKEKQEIVKATKILKMRISPFILALMKENAEAETLRKQFIPSVQEIESIDEQELFTDVNKDDKYSPTKGLVHRYPTKVLIFPSNYCGSYCRYCFRRKLVQEAESSLSRSDYEKIFNYIRKHPNVTEVILSGGDPLVLDDKQLEYIFKNLKEIPTVKVLRIHTRLPVTIPFRITPAFVKMLAKYKPLYMVLHIDTLIEITDPLKEAVTMLVDNGIPCFSSSPLLKGVNDSEETLGELWSKLIELRVKPYYLFHSDPVKGLLHFLVPMKRGIEIMRNLYDNISGLAIPHYCFNIPDGGGHILIDMNSVKEIEAGTYELTNFEGRKFVYRDLGENNS